MDGYVRISKKGNRKGESYRSPSLQTDAIRRWAKQNNVVVGKILEDENVSGGKAVKDRELEKLIKRAEEGISAGIIVKDMTRFARSTLETAMAVARLKDAGARLVGVEDGTDSDRPQGKLIMDIQAAIGEDYRTKIKEDFAASAANAVEDGIHIACRAPTGYLRADHDGGPRNGRLIVDPTAAEAVKAAFELRAEGASHSRVTKLLEDKLGRRVGPTTANRIIKNRVYLGEVRRGDAVNPNAHDPIVSPELFAAANKVKGAYMPRDGTLAEQALLKGLVLCAGCGHKMGIGNMGEGKAAYVCLRKFAAGDCTKPAGAAVSLVDSLVTRKLLDDWDTYLVPGADRDEAAYLAAKQKVHDAEQELELWMDDEDASGPTRRRMILRAEAAVEDARAVLYELPDPGFDDSDVFWKDGVPYMEVNKASDRRVLRRFVTSVVVTKAAPRQKGQNWQPIAERVEVSWRGAKIAS